MKPNEKQICQCSTKECVGLSIVRKQVDRMAAWLYNNLYQEPNQDFIDYCNSQNPERGMVTKKRKIDPEILKMLEIIGTGPINT
jgi:hypothetical protein